MLVHQHKPLQCPAQRAHDNAPDMQCDAVGKQQQPVIRKGQVRIPLPARQLPVDGRQRRTGGAQHGCEARVALVLQRALLLFQPVCMCWADLEQDLCSVSLGPWLVR